MPYRLSKTDDNKFNVIGPDGKPMNNEPFSSRARAIAYMRALYAHAGDTKSDSDVTGLDTSYLKSLHLELSDTELLQRIAVKSVGRDEIRGYTNLWGNPDKVDIEREFFTQHTDFWDDRLGLPRPLTWDHAQDQTMKAPPVIGKIIEFGDDDLGRWYVAQLDRAHKYRTVVDRMIGDGVLGTSSDSAPQYVQREKSKSGSVWIKQWPLFAAALTTTPCEPRMIASVEYAKSIGLDLTNPEAAFEMLRTKTERARLMHKLLRFSTGA